MNEPTKPTLEQLTRAVDRFHGLLHAPQPGLATWNIMVSEAYQEVTEIVGAMSPPALDERKEGGGATMSRPTDQNRFPSHTSGREMALL